MRSNNYKPTKPVYQGPWKTVRRRILERDNHTCQIGLPGCTIKENNVDLLLTSEVGPGARNILEALEINIELVEQGKTVKELVKPYLKLH